MHYQQDTLAFEILPGSGQTVEAVAERVAGEYAVGIAWFV